MKKKILIIGAGITGCTLAALLEKQGIVPTIVDKARASDPNGFGISILPRGLRVLEELGVRPAMEKQGGILRGCKLYDEQGDELNSFGLSLNGIETITLDRRKLLHILRSQLTQTNIQWQTSITAIKRDNKGATVTFTNGRTARYDVVVGADGINSVVRAKLFPAAKPEKVGAAIWMFALPPNCKLKDRKYGQLILGTYRFMAVFPYQQTAAVAFTMPLDPQADPRSVNVAEAFAGMSRQADRILKEAHIDRMYCGHLRQVELQKWYKGRVILAGDAAHAMMPSTGMGASNGIQDAHVLASLIAEMPLEQFDELPEKYQRVQKPIVDAKQHEAYLLGRVMLLNKYQAIVRNKIFSIIPHSLLGMIAVRQ
jgi:2-polyprenyl-6-methoxyphenol hydroxylase-like FAD-dependent oxidoreductase